LDRITYRLLVVLSAASITCGGDGAQRISYKHGVRVATFPAYVSDMRSDGTRLWAETRGWVGLVAAPGLSDPTQLVPPQQTGTASFPSPSLAVGSHQVYFNGPSGNVSAVPTSGGTPRLVASAEQAPSDLQTDDSTVWWAALSPLRIRAVPVSGGTPSDVVVIGSRPYAAATDALFFWRGDLQSSFQLMRLGTNGSPATEIAGAINAYPLTISRGILFYANGFVVERRPTTGGTVTDVATFGNNCRSRCATPEFLAVATNDLFVSATLTYVDGGDPNHIPVVFRVPASGGTPEIIAHP
jgi:hypothetical protein